MTISRQGLTERRRRIEDHRVRPISQPPRREVLGAKGGSRWAVLRSIDTDAGEMTFHFLDYATSPPVVGQYETQGDLQTGYPLPTALFEDYQQWVWPVDNPVTTATVPLLAERNTRGDWILRLPLKGDASLLDPDDPVNECSYG